MRHFGLAVLAAAALTAPATAAQIFATSYSGFNGSGQANGGSYNYWDASFNGTGCTTCDGSVLTDGLGELTDGVATNLLWVDAENLGGIGASGTGPYVGWLNTVTPVPTTVFQFAGSPAISRVRIWLDNSGVGGVSAPSSILVDGVAQSFTAPALGTAGAVDLTGLALTGPSHSVTFGYDSGFVFVSEIEFFDNVGVVPEPAQWALMLGGFGLLGAAARRRRSMTVYA